ncbi:hypothetical protein GCM10010260_81490 [Streptomyces filipinensis]|uniref:Uncharacterized protein n=1 Tax=Streptomyces filipinensis TaxID=66887 RepID=A0A918IJW9_9ACTN|nr:hypothetical protein GCM10010260_81490 [Streptomyces filipinensis]
MTEPGTKERDELIGVWNSAPQWSLTYTSADKGPLFDQGNQQRLVSPAFMDLTTQTRSPASTQAMCSPKPASSW